MRQFVPIVGVIAAAVAFSFSPASAGGDAVATVDSPNAGSVVARRYSNCKALNRRYAHGVGRRGARDRTKSGDPVTNFLRNNLLYRQNRHLDRDKDYVACEKH
jgi:hypothetical protein